MSGAVNAETGAPSPAYNVNEDIEQGKFEPRQQPQGGGNGGGGRSPPPPSSARSIVVDEMHDVAKAKARQNRNHNDGRHVTFNEVVVVTPLHRETSSSVPFIMANGMTVVSGTITDSEFARQNGFEKVKGLVHKKQRIMMCVSVEWTVELLLILLFVSSIIEGIFAMDQCTTALPRSTCGQGLEAFAMAAGAVSAIGTGLLLGWLFLLSGRITQPDARHQVDAQLYGLVTGLLFVWWFATALATTVPVGSPFFFGNAGFFCSWANVLISLKLLSVESKEIGWLTKKIEADQAGRPQYLFLVILFMSGVILSSSGICANACSVAGPTQAMTIFAIVWSVVTTLCLLWLFMQWREISAMMFSSLSVFLATNISLGTALLVILGPFDRLGGALGFFCAFFAVIISWVIVFSKDPRYGDS